MADHSKKQAEKRESDDNASGTDFDNDKSDKSPAGTDLDGILLQKGMAMLPGITYRLPNQGDPLFEKDEGFEHPRQRRKRLAHERKERKKRVKKAVSSKQKRS